MEWLWTPQAIFAKLMHIHMTWSWAGPHWSRSHHHFCQVSCILAIKLADRDSSIHNESQDHSSYLPAAESCFLSLTWFICWLRPLIFQLKTRLWMSPYMEAIQEHWCWPRLCLHSLLLKASITQSRQFGFVKRFSREISSWTKSTQSNNWETFSPTVSQELFSNISKRRSWDGNSFHSLIRIWS